MAIYSMTSYGERSAAVGEMMVHVEIETLNSRKLDIHMEVPAMFRSQGEAWHRLLKEKLHRGRVRVTISCDHPGVFSFPEQQEAFYGVYTQLQKLAAAVGAETEVFALAVKLCAKKASYGWGDQKCLTPVTKLVAEAVEECIRMRGKEGSYLKKHIEHYLSDIARSMEAIAVQLPLRKAHLRTRLQEKIQIREGGFDMDRWEQEVLYFLEKMDIEEECVRMQSHIGLFTATLESEGPAGRKLDFILQEMHREANTLGAKAQDTTIQHAVVAMKEALEKLREQVSNIC